LDEETTRQMSELAELWGLPEVRHNTPVISRCVERVYFQEFGLKQEEGEESKNSLDNTP
jgi:hypothetical protein